jgi:hypothetical protein
MAAARAEEVAAMDKAIAEVRAQYARAKVQVDANTTGFWVSEEALSVRKAFLDVGVLVEKWAGTYRTWAVLGQREDGTPYDANRFLEYGRTDLADAVQSISGEAYDRSLFAALKYTAAATVDAVKPTNWLVVLVLVVAVVVVARR